MHILFTLVALCFLAVNAHGETAGPAPDAGKYLMVLWDAGVPLPVGSPGKVRSMAEPHVTKLGGTLLSRKDNARLILLVLELRRTSKREHRKL